MKRRIAELTRSLAVKTAVTIASLTAELDDIAAGAAADKQWSAARGAVETKAKLHGHLIERKEIGQPGDFAGLSDAEVREKITVEFGPDALKALEILLAARAGPPEPIDSVSIDKPLIDETEQALAIFRH